MIRTVFLSLLLMTGCATAPQQIDNKYFDELFGAEFFENSADPFQDMHRLINELSNESENPASYQNAFNVWYWDRHGRYMPEYIHYQDDDQAFYVKFDVAINIHPDINLKIQNDVLIITGDFVLKGRTSEGRLRLDQKLPVPSNLDPLSMFAWKNGEVYTIRIDKLDS